MNQEKIGQNIKNLRIKKNLTQKEFADKLGVTYQAVSKWENGKNLPDLLLIKQVCDIYDVELEEILGGQKRFKKYIDYRLVGIICALIALIFLSYIIVKMNNKDVVNIQPVVSACEDFKITGIAAYDSKKSTVYISKIEYCGENDNEVYENISCTLYETYNDTISKISTCKEAENMTLDEYLKEVEIKVDKYKAKVGDFNDISMYLEIKASSGKLLDYIHKIPLTIDKTC